MGNYSLSLHYYLLFLLKIVIVWKGHTRRVSEDTVLDRCIPTRRQFLPGHILRPILFRILFLYPTSYPASCPASYPAS